MIRSRVVAPGPRTTAHSGTFRTVVLVVVVAAAVLACSPSAPSGSVSSASPALGAASPEPSGRWPGGTVIAVVTLGAADAELQKAGVDLQSAADKQDLAAMKGAADGLADLVGKLTPQIERLEAYPLTARAGTLYRTAFPPLGAGARQLSDAIAKGDSAGILDGSRLIARSLADYAIARRELGPLVEQAILQQRLLVK